MLLAMVTYDTEENARSAMTRETLLSLGRTVDWTRHRLIISDNGSTDPGTVSMLKSMEDTFTVIYNGKNLGTANAINKAWRLRRQEEHAAKIDNDVVIHQAGWADWMEDVFERDPTIGICGLKRKDLEECPWHPNPWYTSTIRMLPHERGQRWLIVEEVQHVMGTVQAYSSKLLDAIGYLYQPGLYAFDDSLAAIRSSVAGFKSVFLCGFEIDHIDPGGTEFTEWKKDYAGTHMKTYHELRAQYVSGERSPYYDGGFSNG